MFKRLSYMGMSVACNATSTRVAAHQARSNSRSPAMPAAAVRSSSQSTRPTSATATGQPWLWARSRPMLWEWLMK